MASEKNTKVFKNNGLKCVIARLLPSFYVGETEVKQYIHFNQYCKAIHMLLYFSEM